MLLIVTLSISCIFESEPEITTVVKHFEVIAVPLKKYKQLLDVLLEEDFFFFPTLYDLLHSQFLCLKVLPEQNKVCACLARIF